MKNTVKKTDRQRFDNFRYIGCVICGNPHYEIHHIRHSGKKDHSKTFPLCHIHHRTGGYGLAVHDGLESWERVNNTEQFYLDKVNKLLDTAET